jgi:hypothetical protein
MNDIVPHRNFLAAQSRLRRSVENHRPGRLIVIIGVGGVGKTTLRWSILREIYGNPLQWSTGRLPVVEVMALLAEKAFFNSKGWAEDSLNQLFIPDFSWLTRGAERTPQMEAIDEAVSVSRAFWGEKRPKLTETGSWNNFKDNARERRLRIYSLEHASALCFNHKDTTPAHHIINLMSCMESAGSMGLLTTIQNGTELWKGRSEIRRRMDVIWLAPYDVSDPEDLKCYVGLLKKLSSQFTFEPADLVETLAPEIAAATAAVYAEMVNLLERAFENAMDDGRTVIREKDFHAAYYSREDLTTLWNDVEAFWEAKRADKASAVTERADQMWPTVA